MATQNLNQCCYCIVCVVEMDCVVCGCGLCNTGRQNVPHSHVPFSTASSYITAVWLHMCASCTPPFPPLTFPVFFIQTAVTISSINSFSLNSLFNVLCYLCTVLSVLLTDNSIGSYIFKNSLSKENGLTWWYHVLVLEGSK